MVLRVRRGEPACPAVRLARLNETLSWPGSKHVASIAPPLVVVTWLRFTGVLHGAFVGMTTGSYVAANEHRHKRISRGAVSGP